MISGISFFLLPAGSKTRKFFSAALFLPCLWISPGPALGEGLGREELRVPAALFSSTSFEVALLSAQGPEKETSLYTVKVSSWSGGSSQVKTVQPDSTHKCELRLKSSGHYLISASAGEITRLRVVRVLPGYLTLLPPLVAILLALVFRQVLPALFLGIWLGTSLLYGLNPLTGLVRLIDTYLVKAMTNADHVRIIIFSMTLGGMVGLITRSGGALGLVKQFSRYAVSRRLGQVSTWLMGLLIFFDDYSNTLMVGNTMRPFTDKLRISREKLSFIVDSTAAPVASVALISTWIGFELGLLNSSFSSLNLDANAYWTFLRALPYNFYSWACIIFVLMIAVTQRDYGPMHSAEQRAADTGEVLAAGAQPLMDKELADLGAEEVATPRGYNALVPIAAMAVALLAGLYISGVSALEGSGKPSTLYHIVGQADPFQVLLWASFAGTFAAAGLALAQRLLSLRQSVDAFLVGFKSMTLAMIILTLARLIQIICTDLKTADYILEISRGIFDPQFLPALTFIIAALISFSTGTSWGTMAILMPLIIPLAHILPTEAGLTAQAVDRTMVATVGAILSGAVFGDHCSPISDTTIMSSMASGADHIDHVRTQLPYAVTVAVVSVPLGYLAAGTGLLNPFLSFLLILGILWLVLRVFGKKIQPGAA